MELEFSEDLDVRSLEGKFGEAFALSSQDLPVANDSTKDDVPANPPPPPPETPSTPVQRKAKSWDHHEAPFESLQQVQQPSNLLQLQGVRAKSTVNLSQKEAAPSQSATMLDSSLVKSSKLSKSMAQLNQRPDQSIESVRKSTWNPSKSQYTLKIPVDAKTEAMTAASLSKPHKHKNSGKQQHHLETPGCDVKQRKNSFIQLEKWLSQVFNPEQTNIKSITTVQQQQHRSQAKPSKSKHAPIECPVITNRIDTVSAGSVASSRRSRKSLAPDIPSSNKHKPKPC